MIEWDTETDLSNAERHILQRAAEKVVKSIMQRERNLTKRSLLLNQASSNGYNVWLEAAKYASRKKTKGRR